MKRTIIIRNTFARDTKTQPTLEVTYEDEQGRRWTKSFADEAAYQTWLKQVGTKIARIVARRTLTNKDDEKEERLRYSSAGVMQKGTCPVCGAKIEGRSALRRHIEENHPERSEQHDVVGSKEDVAYGEGYHSESGTNPYKDPAQAAAWEKGRTARKNAAKMRRGYYMGEVRGRRFEAPIQRDSLYEYADLSASQLNAAWAKVQTESSKLNSEMIAEGRGYEKPSETRTKNDPLAQRVNALSVKYNAIVAEMNRRKRFSGSLKPIPPGQRQSFSSRDGYYMGEVRGRRFEAPRARDGVNWEMSRGGPLTGGLFRTKADADAYAERMRRSWPNQEVGVFEMQTASLRSGKPKFAVMLRDRPTQRGDSHGYVGFQHGQDTEGPSFDYKSERGYVGRVLNSNGSVLAESEPFISERSVKAWLNQKAEEFIRQGKRVTTKFGIVFYDPAYVRA